MKQHLQNSGYLADDYQENLLQVAEELPVFFSLQELEKEIGKLEKEMLQAAKELAFEKAADLRDRIKTLRRLEIELG
jgi:excinuclease ABC subunit B